VERISVDTHLLAQVCRDSERVCITEINLFFFFFFFVIDPYKLIKVGTKEAVNGDPLIPVQKELEAIKYVKVPGLPSFTGKTPLIYLSFHVQ
jgi:hypothetical protein